MYVTPYNRLYFIFSVLSIRYLPYTECIKASQTFPVQNRIKMTVINATTQSRARLWSYVHLKKKCDDACFT